MKFVYSWNLQTARGQQKVLGSALPVLHLSCLLYKNCFLSFKTFSLFASVPLLNNVLYQWCTVPLIFRWCPCASYMYCPMYPVPWLWYCFVHPVCTVPVKMYCVLRNIMYVYSKRHVLYRICTSTLEILSYYTICTVLCVVPHRLYIDCCEYQ